MDAGDYERGLARALQLSSRVADSDEGGEKPSLYVGIDFGRREDAGALIQALSMTHHRFSFLGLKAHATNMSGSVFSRENAEAWGNELSSLLNDRPPSSVAVAMDVRTHLAMLQANALPRSKGVLGGDKDAWAIIGPSREGASSSDGILLEYRYDYTDPYGGCDPLLCPSTGLTIPPTSATKTEHGADIDDAYAAAYCALVGSGMDHSSSLAISASVGAVFRELGTTDDAGEFCPPSYTWSVVDEIAERGRRAWQNIKTEDGLPRTLYKEFGYK